MLVTSSSWSRATGAPSGSRCAGSGYGGLSSPCKLLQALVTSFASTVQGPESPVGWSRSRCRPRVPWSDLENATAGPDAPTDPTTMAPAVVAVVVARNPGTWFDETMASLAGQDYPNLSILVIDAASTEEVKPRVAQSAPGAFVRRIDSNPGYGAAANDVLDVVDGAAFYLMCHDDIALEPDVVRTLVEEAYRSNAAIVGPKL